MNQSNSRIEAEDVFSGPYEGDQALASFPSSKWLGRLNDLRQRGAATTGVFANVGCLSRAQKKPLNQNFNKSPFD